MVLPLLRYNSSVLMLMSVPGRIQTKVHLIGGVIQSDTVVQCLRSVPEHKEGKLIIIFWSFPRVNM